MPELKQLLDFYDPTRTGLAAMNVIQGQQMLQIQQNAREQQSRNLEIDNLRQAYQSANPMESYPLYARLMQANGQQPPSVNEYYANTEMYDKLLTAPVGSDEHNDTMSKWVKTSPGSRAVIEKEVGAQRAFRGAQNLNIAAGLGGDEDTAELTRQSPALQTQVGNALAQSPLQKEKAKALEDLNKEHEKVAVYANTQLSTLIPGAKAAGLAIERAAPLVARVDSIEQEYQKNLKSLGQDKAYKARQERMTVNEDLLQFDQRRRDSIPKLQQSLQQIEDQQTQLQSRAELIAQGVEPLKEGESLELLAGKVDASQHQLAYTRASLEFAKNPTPANLDALRNLKGQMDETVTKLSERKKASMESLNIRRSQVDEKVFMDRYKIDRELKIGQAQVAWMESGGDPKKAHQFAKQFGVKVDEVREASKDPNRPLTQVNLSEEKEEAKAVGRGFGEQYVESQKAGVAATGKLAKLDRMESLLEGVTTGTLTPTITDIQGIGEALGLKVDATLPAKQAIVALSNEIALQLRNPAGGAGMPGALSDKDLAFLQSMPPGLARTNEGNKLIVETARKVAQRDQQIAKMARTYRQKNGRLDEGFYDEVQAYGEANPLFKGKSIPTSEVQPPSSSVAPFNDAEKERRYQEWKKNHK